MLMKKGESMKYTKLNPIIVLIAGKARSGKTTLANYLKEQLETKKEKVILSPYTKYLKQYIQEITGKEITEQNKPRKLLQKLSSDLIKKELGKEDFFIKRQLEDLEIYSYFADVIIISDVRFPEEIETVKELYNTISIGVIRKNYQSDLTNEEKNDITEIALDNYKDYDYLVENISNSSLKESAKKIIQEIEKRR